MSAPMSMEEWQRRMKAEKESARKKKSESSEILHGYRGELRDEELKLKKIRDEERQRQLDAERNLHSYQAKELEGIKAMEQRTPRNQQLVHADAASSATKNYMDGFDVVAGSVSERAAALAASAGSGHTFQPDISFDSPVMVPYSSRRIGEEIIPETTLPTSFQNHENSTSNEGQTKFHSFEEKPSVNSNVNTGMSFLEYASTPNSLENTHTTQIEQSQPGDEQTGHDTSGIFAEPSNNNETILTKTNVLFSFGVVSIQNSPELFGYMTATEKVVVQCLDAIKPSGIEYDPKQRPFVRSCVPDASYEPRSGKTNTKRSLVTAAVPILYNPKVVSRADTKHIIVTALQDAIQCGSFLQMAQTT